MTTPALSISTIKDWVQTAAILIAIHTQSEDIEKLLATLGSGQNPKRVLSIDEVAQGLTACYLDGVGLLDDARLLAINGRVARALSLAILALEELAKIPDLDFLTVRIELLSSINTDSQTRSGSSSL